MAIEQFTDAVEIDGSQDTTQLKVQGHSTQTNPLQQWENHSADPVAKLHNDGRLEVGDMPQTSTTLLASYRDDSDTPVSQADRGLHTSAHLVDQGGDVSIEWSVHEVTLDGNSTDLAKVAALRAGVTKQGSGVLDEAVGLEIADITGAIENYAIKTGLGKVQLGDLGAGFVQSDANGELSSGKIAHILLTQSLTTIEFQNVGINNYKKVVGIMRYRGSGAGSAQFPRLKMVFDNDTNAALYTCLSHNGDSVPTNYVSYSSASGNCIGSYGTTPLDGAGYSFFTSYQFTIIPPQSPDTFTHILGNGGAHFINVFFKHSDYGAYYKSSPTLNNLKLTLGGSGEQFVAGTEVTLYGYK